MKNHCRVLDPTHNLRSRDSAGKEKTPRKRGINIVYIIPGEDPSLKKSVQAEFFITFNDIINDISYYTAQLSQRFVKSLKAWR
jgi:hypothetical protein